MSGEDVVLGFSDMAGYTSAEGRGKNPYMGAVVGRVANRIAEARFSLDGEEFSLAKVSRRAQLRDSHVYRQKQVLSREICYKAASIVGGLV